MENTCTTMGTGNCAVRLTQLETVALRVLFNDADGNGHDFGFTDSIRESGVMGLHQISGVVSSLAKKGIVYVEDDCASNYGSMFTWGKTVGGRGHGSGDGIGGHYPESFEEFCKLGSLVPA
jgi:hypothetical protein